MTCRIHEPCEASDRTFRWPAGERDSATRQGGYCHREMRDPERHSNTARPNRRDLMAFVVTLDVVSRQHRCANVVLNNPNRGTGRYAAARPAFDYVESEDAAIKARGDVGIAK